MKFIISAISIFICMFCNGQKISTDAVSKAFNSIEENPSVIRFTNQKEINNRDGHLQGVQLIERNTTEYVILTGSSDSYSYYSVVKLGLENKVISVNKLMDKPFKHAGGFQIFQNYMAIGIEDNSKKDKSKVCIYDISNPENPTVNPISVITREGKPMRSTAGCVGFTKYKNNALVVVGDWDTKHIDFYSCEFDNMGTVDFEAVFSMDTEAVSKEGWTDKNWHSYQNINLFSNHNKLYLVGLGKNERDENVADLFSLEEGDSGNFTIIKIASKIFNCTNNCNFKAGAGVVFSDEGDFGIISCGYTIESTSFLNYFSTSKKED